MSRRRPMRDTKDFVAGLPIFHQNSVHLWQLRLTRYILNTFMPRTSGSVYDVQQKQNPGPSGPSGNDDLDTSELFEDEVEAINEDEEPHDVDKIDDQVGFLTHHHKSDNIDN
jgi:hypothetical protein